ncbi:spore photoproduct lyase [Melghiribacillus thermohalophilus]|nr:spore photoproduct lyase [Melghiribacillus thermohalophilus]
MKPFVPDMVFFEPDSLNYPLGETLVEHYRKLNIPVRQTTSHNQVRGIPGDTALQQYRNAKRTLVVGLKKSLKFEPSLPSAEYALPLATGCMAHCHYCYLQTTLGKKPYIRVYVNVDDILKRAEQYIQEREPEITRFDASCTSDIVGVEHITGSLKRAIEFMGKQTNGRLRFVTKFEHVDSLLDAEHNGHTRFRFSINTDYVIKYLEPGTSRMDGRMAAANKVAAAGYPLGFIVAPIIRYDGWMNDYETLFQKLKERLRYKPENDLTFELIQHRYTMTAKKIIQERYPNTQLRMEESERQKKYGRYGRVKYVYPKMQAQEIKDHITGLVHDYFPDARVEYFT